MSWKQGIGFNNGVKSRFNQDKGQSYVYEDLMARESVGG
jgi:hypothetical protein